MIPIRVIIREFVDTTHSDLSIKHGLSDSKDKGNGKLTKADELWPKNDVQTQIYLLIDEVNEYAELKTLHFDEWVEF